MAVRVTKVEVAGTTIVVVSAPLDAGPMLALTSAEREVCVLVQRGLSNAAIAAARATSPSTVANQLRSAYRKLGVANRGELVTRLGHTT